MNEKAKKYITVSASSHPLGVEGEILETKLSSIDSRKRMMGKRKRIYELKSKTMNAQPLPRPIPSAPRGGEALDI